MSKTAKKKKKADFQKVKLKVGRKVKRINETIPEVKVGRIQIKSQFKTLTENSKTALGKISKYSLEELLKRCSNCNATIRHDALVKLRGLFSTHSPDGTSDSSNEALVQSSAVLQAISSLYVDKDAVVRQDLRRVLRAVLCAIGRQQSAEKIVPNFGDRLIGSNDKSESFVVAHLMGNSNKVSHFVKRTIGDNRKDLSNSAIVFGCNQTEPINKENGVSSSQEVDLAQSFDHSAALDASSHPLLVLALCRSMTHIEESIQVDSLSILDVYMDCCPKLVATGSARILDDFLPLISRQHLIGRAGVGGGATSVNVGGVSGRSLKDNPTSKLATQQWRVKVLERLQRFLGIVVDQQQRRTESKSGGNDNSEKMSRFYQSLGTDGDLGQVSNNGPITSLLDSATQIKQVATVLVPLLLDCWAETGLGSSESAGSSGVALDETSMSIVQRVLNILQLLFSLLVNNSQLSRFMECSWLKEQFEKRLVQQLLSNFPHQVSLRRSKGRTDQNAPTLFDNISQYEINQSINLSVCNVMSYLFPSTTSNNTAKTTSANISGNATTGIAANTATTLAGPARFQFWLEKQRHHEQPGQKIKDKTAVDSSVWLEDIVNYVVSVLEREQQSHRELQLLYEQQNNNESQQQQNQVRESRQQHLLQLQQQNKQQLQKHRQDEQEKQKSEKQNPREVRELKQKSKLQQQKQYNQQLQQLKQKQKQNKLKPQKEKQNPQQQRKKEQKQKSKVRTLKPDQMLLILDLVEAFMNQPLPTVIHSRVIDACMATYNSCSSANTFTRRSWFLFFRKMFLQSFGRIPLHELPSVCNWIGSLPAELLQAAGTVPSSTHLGFDAVLEAVHLAGRQQFQPFVARFSEKLDEFLDVEYISKLTAKQQIVWAECFVWISHLDTRHFEKITFLLLTKQLSFSAFCCICDLLVHRFDAWNSARNSFKLDDLTRMLLTLILGIRSSMLESIQQEVLDLQQQHQSEGWLVTEGTVTLVADHKRAVQLESDWHVQQKIIRYIFSVIRRLPDAEAVRNAVGSFIVKFLVTSSGALSLHTAASITLSVSLLHSSLSTLPPLSPSLNASLRESMLQLLLALASSYKTLANRGSVWSGRRKIPDGSLTAVVVAKATAENVANAVVAAVPVTISTGESLGTAAKESDLQVKQTASVEMKELASMQPSRVEATNLEASVTNAASSDEKQNEEFMEDAELTAADIREGSCITGEKCNAKQPAHLILLNVMAGILAVDAGLFTMLLDKIESLKLEGRRQDLIERYMSLLRQLSLAEELQEVESSLIERLHQLCR